MISWHESVWLFHTCSWRPAIVAEELHFTSHKIASRTKLNLVFSRGCTRQPHGTFYLWFSHFYTWNQQSYPWVLEELITTWGDPLSTKKGVVIGTGHFVLTIGMFFYDNWAASVPVCGRSIGLDGCKGQFQPKSFHDY